MDNNRIDKKQRFLLIRVVIISALKKEVVIEIFVKLTQMRTLLRPLSSGDLTSLGQVQ